MFCKDLRGPRRKRRREDSMRLVTALFAMFIFAVIIMANLGALPRFVTDIYLFPLGDKVGHFLLIGGLAFLLDLTALRGTAQKPLPIIAKVLRRPRHSGHHRGNITDFHSGAQFFVPRPRGRLRGHTLFYRPRLCRPSPEGGSCPGQLGRRGHPRHGRPPVGSTRL